MDRAGPVIDEIIGLCGAPVDHVDDRTVERGVVQQFAGRWCDKADAEQIFVTKSVRDLVTGHAIQFREAGNFDMKGIEKPVPVFEVVWRAQLQAARNGSTNVAIRGLAVLGEVEGGFLVFIIMGSSIERQGGFDGLVVDLGGVLGEDGPEGIRLGPTPEGRPYLEFQQYLLSLYVRGVLLAVNSKNNEADVLEVLRNHPHAVLKEHHFAHILLHIILCLLTY